MRQQYEWTLLDTFDWLNPCYELCQDHRTVAQQRLDKVDSAPGLAWAVKP